MSNEIRFAVNRILEGYSPFQVIEAITYKGIRFSGFDKPKRTPTHPQKSHVVLTKINGKPKLIRFGEQGAEVAGKPKPNESERMKKKRTSFKARHRKNIARGKISPSWWANKYKW